MLYRSLLIAAVLGLPALAIAGASATDREAETDIKVQCIVDFIASEQDDSTKDAYVSECVTKKMANRGAQSGTKG